MPTGWIKLLRGIGWAAVAGLLLPGPPALAEDGEDSFSGSVEVLYRNVSQDGSTEKYDEDFDGLDSGGRLANLSVNWLSDESGLLDYARLNVNGLGGDPYEWSTFRLGQKDSYELSISHTKQSGSTAVYRNQHDRLTFCAPFLSPLHQFTRIDAELFKQLDVAQHQPAPVDDSRHTLAGP